MTKLILALSTTTGLLVMASTILFPSTASASHDTIPPGVAPGFIEAAIHERCVDFGWNVVQAMWISRDNNPADTTVKVQAGDPSVRLQLNRITYRCKPSTHMYGSTKVVSTNPNVGLNGLFTDMYYPANSNDYEHAPIEDFNYPGPFFKDQDIILTLNTKGTATNTSNTHVCAKVDNAEATVTTTEPHNFDPAPGYCRISSNDLKIRVNVDTTPHNANIETRCTANGPEVRVKTNTNHRFDLRLVRNGSELGENYKLEDKPGGEWHSFNNIPKSWVDRVSSNFRVKTYDRTTRITVLTASMGLRCGEWNYMHSSFSTVPNSALQENGPEFPRRDAGTIMKISDTIRNNGDGPGVDYNQRIRIKVGDDVWRTHKIWTGLGSLNDGAERTRTDTYKLPDNLENNTRVCFRGEVRPYHGTIRKEGGAESATIVATEGTGSEDWRESETRCVRVKAANVREPLLECGNTVTLSDPVPNQNFSIRVNFVNNGNQAFENPTKKIVIYDEGGLDIPGSPPQKDYGPNPVVAAGGGTGEATFNNIKASSAGIYKVKWRLSAGTGDDNSFNEVDCERDITITDKPYIQVKGGDVIAGKDFKDGADCEEDPNAQLRAHNRGGTPNWGGAGAQLAAYALSRIEGFVTSQQRTSPGAPKGLTFANSGSAQANSTYGGDWQEQFMSCIEDYWANLPPDATVITNRHTINGLNIAKGQKTTIYVDDDVYIRNNITFNDADSYANTADIPEFTLIANGDIFIDSGVTRLDGTYIANRRYIYTCTRGFNVMPDPAHIASNTEPRHCQNSLTVNGSLIARAVKFQRSNGATYNDTVAETIQFTPLLWLDTITNTGEVEYDSIISLPPTL